MGEKLLQHNPFLRRRRLLPAAAAAAVLRKMSNRSLQKTFASTCH
jgi:hypothetical protein